MTAPSIVITGLALRLPGACDQEAFWRLLVNGVDRTAPVSHARRALAGSPDWDDRIGEVDGIDEFDASYFGIDEDEARFMDPQHRVLLEVAHDAACDAGLVESGRPVDRRYAVVVAVSTNAYYPLVCRHLDRHGPVGVPARTIMNQLNSAMAARVSHQYNLTGPVLALDTACSSFLSSFVAAADLIRHQGCDGAIVGGVNLLSSTYTTMLCNAAGITTPHPFTRVFDEAADGTLIGEGAVVCVLEREDLARARNRKSYGRILGYAMNNDGSSLNIMAPNPRGQARVIADCYADGVDPRRVGYIETHGTGTRIGDPIEVNALAQVFTPAMFGPDRVGIGSVKCNVGHLLSAAGGAGLAKLLLSLSRATMAPNLHLGTVNPLLELDQTPFDIVTEPTPWPRRDGLPRAGAITSLGLGGTNVHVVVEEGDPERPGPRLRDHTFCVSAASHDALGRLIAEVERRLRSADTDPYNLAMTLARFRPALQWRTVLRWDADAAALVGEPALRQVSGVRRVVWRTSPGASEFEERLRTILACRLVVSDADAGRGELPVALVDAPDADASVRLDPTVADLDIAAALFAAGCPINWAHLFPDGIGTVLTLDPYPFDRLPLWLPL